MDFARKIGKSNESRSLEKRKRLSKVTVSDGFMRKDPPIVEDHRLVNWRTWLENRKKQYDHIENRSGRQRTDQLINSCEKVRPQVEMRNIMDYATIPVPVEPDKYRGGPEFWHTPEFLSNRGDPCLSDIAVTPSRKDLNLQPEILHVSLPTLIEKEKGLVSIQSKKTGWQNSEYLKRRKKELEREIKRLMPKEPETSDLAIQGHSLVKEKILVSYTRAPRITEVLYEEDEILDQERYSTEDSNKYPETTSLIFNGSLGKILEKKIVLRNKKIVPLTCYWRKYELRVPQLPLPVTFDTPFYFNKNKIIIPPGQEIKVKIWYRPRSPGAFQEFWKLHTEPELSTSMPILRFWGFTGTTGNSKKRDAKFNAQSVENYLDRCLRDSLIRQILEEILDRVEIPEPPEPEYSSLFLQSDLFTLKNPGYFYHPALAAEFNKIYQEARGEDSSTWNSSLDDLGEFLLQSRQSTRKNDLLNRFHESCKKSLKPSLYDYGKQMDKHVAVYNLLCSFFNGFEFESEHTMNIPGIANSHENFLRRETFFIRIYESLVDTVNRVCAVIDSFSRLNEAEK